MGSLDLPSKDSPHLQLVVATDEEILAQQNANSGEWRGALSVDAYLRREVHLFNQELTKDGGITAWMLVYQPDPQGHRQVVCGCETINKRALVASHGKVQDVVCHGVASVFCPEQFRGRGYASRMIADLGIKLKSWQTDVEKPCLFSVLYSDIGKGFYAARGWHPFPSAHVALPESTEPAPEYARLLESHHLQELCAIDEKLIRQRLAKTETTDRHVAAVIPDHRIVLWHHAREDFVTNELYGKTPKVKGAMVGDVSGKRVWAYFTRMWSNPNEETPNTLHILRLVVEDESTSDCAASELTKAITAIIRVAQVEAAQWHMKAVSIWNPSSAVLTAIRSIDPKAAVVHRETDSITSLRWYGDGTWQDVDWIYNEKYGWN